MAYAMIQIQTHGKRERDRGHPNRNEEDCTLLACDVLKELELFLAFGYPELVLGLDIAAYNLAAEVACCEGVPYGLWKAPKQVD